MHVAHHLGGGLHRREGEMAPLPLVVDLVDGEAARELADVGVDQVAIRNAPRRRSFEERIAGTVHPGDLANPRRQRLPVPRPVHHQIREAVATAVGPRRHRREEPGPVPPRHDPVVVPLADAADVGGGDDRLEERHVDALAAAGARRVAERDQRPGGRDERGGDAGLAAVEPDRRIVRLPGYVQRATERRRHEVAAAVAPRSTLPEGRDRRHTRPVRGPQTLVADAERVERAGSPRLDDRVRGRRQAATVASRALARSSTRLACCRSWRGRTSSRGRARRRAERRQRRVASPPGGSMRITSAPRSARSFPQ